MYTYEYEETMCMVARKGRRSRENKFDETMTGTPGLVMSYVEIERGRSLLVVHSSLEILRNQNSETKRGTLISQITLAVSRGTVDIPIYPSVVVRQTAHVTRCPIGP